MYKILAVLLVLTGCAAQRPAPIEKVPTKHSTKRAIQKIEPVIDDDEFHEVKPESIARHADVQTRMDRIARLKRSGKSFAQLKKEMDDLKKDRQPVEDAYTDDQPVPQPKPQNDYDQED